MKFITIFSLCCFLCCALVSAQTKSKKNYLKAIPASQKRLLRSDGKTVSTAFEKMNTVVDPEAIKKDIDLWFDWLHAVHPDLSYTVPDVEKFYGTVARIKAEIDSPMTSIEFWRRFSILNSLLSDGHLVAGNPDPEYLKEYLARGGTLFPFEVIVKKRSELVVAGQLGGNSSDESGSQIISINKIPVETILNDLLARLHGDGDEHRSALLEKRFAYYQMLFYGESKKFEIELKKNGVVRKVSLPGSKSLPLTYKTNGNFADNFQFRILDDRNALLTVKTFGWDKKKDFFDFTQNVFAEIKKKQILHLIIDVRENSGGDDDMWRDGILKYIAAKPYRWGSKYRKKILARYRDAGQIVGQVVDGQIETMIAVEPENQNKFTGQVYVLIGPYTYSSAILFVNTVQDYNFGQLVGKPTGGKSGQTGGIQFLTLPNTHLISVCPRFYLERPNGGKLKEPVKPDLEIDYDQTKPDELIEKLLEKSKVSGN